jgi:hypothetical protein
MAFPATICQHVCEKYFKRSPYIQNTATETEKTAPKRTAKRVQVPESMTNFKLNRNDPIQHLNITNVNYVSS